MNNKIELTTCEYESPQSSQVVNSILLFIFIIHINSATEILGFVNGFAGQGGQQQPQQP